MSDIVFHQKAHLQTVCKHFSFQNRWTQDVIYTRPLKFVWEVVLNSNYFIFHWIQTLLNLNKASSQSKTVKTSQLACWLLDIEISRTYALCHFPAWCMIEPLADVFSSNKKQIFSPSGRLIWIYTCSFHLWSRLMLAADTSVNPWKGGKTKKDVNNGIVN